MFAVSLIMSHISSLFSAGVQLPSVWGVCSNSCQPSVNQEKNQWAADLRV